MEVSQLFYRTFSDQNLDGLRRRGIQFNVSGLTTTFCLWFISTYSCGSSRLTLYTYSIRYFRYLGKRPPWKTKWIVFGHSRTVVTWARAREDSTANERLNDSRYQDNHKFPRVFRFFFFLISSIFYNYITKGVARSTSGDSMKLSRRILHRSSWCLYYSCRELFILRFWIFISRFYWQIEKRYKLNWRIPGKIFLEKWSLVKKGPRKNGPLKKRSPEKWFLEKRVPGKMVPWKKGPRKNGPLKKRSPEKWTLEKKVPGKMVHGILEILFNS